MRKKIYDDAVTLRQQIETQKDSALASTTAATATSGQFSTPVPRVELNKDASEAIAISVKEMVQSVLNKEYSADVCMSYLTGGEARDPEVTGICKAVWVERSSAAKKRLDEYEKIRAYAPDDATRLLQKALDEDHPKNIRDDLKKWLEKNKLNIDITLFLNGAGYSLQRQLAVIQLKIGSQQADTPPKAEPPKKAESPKKAEPPKKAVGADASPKTGTPSTDTPKGK